MGGRAACQWQRTLRTECIAKEVSFRDVTNDPLYDWKQLLRSARPGFASRIIGQGIVRVVFRIIETQVDSNYTKEDGHGRHFFEFLRADGSAMRLHYHMRGPPDETKCVGPPRDAAQPAVYGAAATQADVPGGGAAQTAVRSGGASQPAELGGDASLPFTLEHMEEAARSRQTTGRHEASDALKTLVDHHHGETASGAVDITHGSAFDWPRWVAKIKGARAVIRDGVHRVYAVRWAPHSAPEVVFCYGNKTYSTLRPRNAAYTSSAKETPFVFHGKGNWVTEPLLSAAPKAAAAWLLLRDQPGCGKV